jgi:HSP20 family protein
MSATLKPRWSVVLPKPFDGMQREMDQMFDTLFRNGHADGLYAPATVWEEEGRWCVEIDLPGVKQEDVDLTLEKNALRIAAVRKGPDGDRKYWHQERAFGAIERTISLPETVDSDGIEAELNDGVLQLSLAKKPELQPKKIAVKAG